MVAICDVEEGAFKNKVATNLGEDNKVLDFTGINLYNDAKEMFDKEKLDFIDCIEIDRESKINPPESSLQTIQIAWAEKKSADLKEIIKL